MVELKIVNIAGIILTFIAAICFAWPKEKIMPDKVTWNDLIGSGKMEKIEKKKKNFNIAGFILLMLGLTCQIILAFEFFPSLKSLIWRP